MPPKFMPQTEVRQRLGSDNALLIARQLVSQLVALVTTSAPPTTTAAYNLREGKIAGFFSAAEALGIDTEFRRFYLEAEQDNLL